MTDVVRIGLIGTGDIARRGHIPAVNRQARCRLVAVCDVDDGRRAAVLADVPVAGYNSHGDLLARSDVDAVIIATPPTATPWIVTAALDAGKHVLSEKPIAASLDDAIAVAERAKETEQVIQVGFKNRFSPLVRMARRWIDEGRLGEPLLFNLGSWDERYDVSDTEHVARITGWLRSGSVNVHEACHQIDYLTYLGAGEVVGVQAAGIVSRPEWGGANYTASLLQFDSGHSARLESGWFFPHISRSWSDFRILGPKGVVELNREEQWVALTTSDMTVRETLDRPWNDVCFDAQLDHFLDCIQSRSEPETNLEGAVANVRAIDLIERSMRIWPAPGPVALPSGVSGPR